MPIIRNVIAGEKVFASAKIARRFPLSVPAATDATLDNLAQLQVNTLPNCTWYCLISAGPAGCTFTPRWAVDNFGSAPRFFALTAPQVIVVGVPFSLSQRVAANMISGIVSVPGGGLDPLATVTIILTASQ